MLTKRSARSVTNNCGVSAYFNSNAANQVSMPRAYSSNVGTERNWVLISTF